jgi:predicted PurR-regulated permease PerM
MNNMIKQGQPDAPTPHQTRASAFSVGTWAAVLFLATLLMLGYLVLRDFVVPLVWGSTGLWLLATGEVWAGTGLLLWGALIVSLVDNVIRPLAISNTARIPFFLVLLGVLGGLRAFGLVGLFLGPIVLTVMLAVWREWLEERVHDATDETQTDSNTG